MFCLLHIPNFTIAVVSGRKCSGPACGDYQGAFRCLFIFLWILTLSHMGTWSRTFYRFLALQLVKKFDAWIQIIRILGFLRLKLTLGTRYTVFCFFSDMLISLRLSSLLNFGIWSWSSVFQVFQKRMPPEAIDLASRLLQYSPSLRCTAVSLASSYLWSFLNFVSNEAQYCPKPILIA